jgi:uncharacterized membrane protein
MITVSIKGVLIGVLLIALIVLVVFLIVLVSNATDTIKKANTILDGGMEAAAGAKAKADNLSATVKEGAAKVGSVAQIGVNAGQKIVDRVIR